MQPAVNAPAELRIPISTVPAKSTTTSPAPAGGWTNMIMSPPAMQIGSLPERKSTTAITSTILSASGLQAAVDIERSSPTSSGSSSKSSKGMRLAFKDITYTVEAKDPVTKKMVPKQILKGCTGVVKAGSLNAIMGSSGGGKTSLLDTLANRKDARLVTGQVLTDGNVRDNATFTHNAGYVTQEDIVMGTLTVRENLLFSARLRLASEMSDEDKQQRVQQVIDELGLSKVADSRVGDEYVRGISGGERKRVNIGMELITSPTILFLDEPTTGLDSSTSLSVLLLLKSLAEVTRRRDAEQRGRTIILSIHQPRFKIFELFDRVIVMSEGNIVYQGTVENCVPYFGSIGYDCPSFNNPADFLLDVVTGEEPVRGAQRIQASNAVEQKQRRVQAIERLCQAYQASDMATQAATQFERERSTADKDTSHLRSSFGVSWLSQAWICAGRAIKNVLRNPATSVGQIAVNLVLGVIVGFIYFRIDKHDNRERAVRDRTGCIFFCVVQFMFANMGGIEAFLKERVIFMHEKASGYYKTSSYYVAKVLSDMVPVRVVPTIIFATVVYFLAGLQREVGKYFVFIAVCVLQTEVAASVCFFISASTSVFAVANTLVTMWYVMSMIFSGLLVSITSWPDGSRWIGYLSFCKYSYELLVENEMAGLTFDCSDGGPCTGDEMLGERYLNISTGEQGTKVAAMLVFAAVFLCLGYLQLDRVRRK